MDKSGFEVKTCAKIMQKNMISFEKSYKRGHLFFAAGAFSQTKCSKKHENMRISRKNIKMCHLFFAAGAFSPKRCSKNHENMRISRKT